MHRPAIVAETLPELPIDVLLCLESLELRWAHQNLIRQTPTVHWATLNAEAMGILRHATHPAYPTPSAEDIVVADAWLTLSDADRLTAVQAVRATRAGRPNDGGGG